MPTILHQLMVQCLFEVLKRHVAAHAPGLVPVAPLPVRLWSGKMREPDVMFLRPERVLDSRRPPEGADLVVEVLSEGEENRHRDLEVKRREHARARIQEYWIVDPQNRQVIGLPLVVGGGLGLYLKREEIRRSGQRTLLQELPDARSTNDIDMFLRAEILADLDRTRDVAGVIARLKYEPVDAAKYLQWKKSVRVAGNDLEVKIDILVGPIGAHR